MHCCLAKVSTDRAVIPNHCRGCERSLGVPWEMIKFQLIGLETFVTFIYCKYIFLFVNVRQAPAN